MLHRHLTSAFRALDSKWGNPVDLDSQESLETCLPAIVDKPSTTFSSEEYLKTIRRRPKPYSRKEEVVNTKRKSRDSFSNISLARYQSSSHVPSDVGGSVSSLESKVTDPSVLEELTSLIEDLKKPLEDPIEDHGKYITEDAVEKVSTDVEDIVERKKNELDRIFQRLKQKAFAYVEQKYKS